MARRQHLLFWALFGFLAAIGVTKTYAEMPFEPGEKLTYHIQWGVIPIGTGVLWVRNVAEYKGQPIYHISIEGRSNSFLSVFFKVEDFVQSFWDAEKFHTLAFQKIQNEGEHHINEIYLFDPQDQKVKWFNTKRRVREFDIPYGVQDAISCLYNLRRLGVEGQEALNMDVHQDEKNYVLSVDSIKETSVRIKPLGKVKTWKVVPHAKHEGMFLREGTMWVWFTQDAKHIPVMVKVKAPIFGKLTAKLVEIENVLDPQPSAVAEELRVLSEELKYEKQTENNS